MEAAKEDFQPAPSNAAVIAVRIVNKAVAGTATKSAKLINCFSCCITEITFLTAFCTSNAFWALDLDLPLLKMIMKKHYFLFGNMQLDLLHMDYAER